jgi:hypothetical protein
MVRPPPSFFDSNAGKQKFADTVVDLIQHPDEDILTALKMETAEVFLASFHRPNLHIAAAAKVGETGPAAWPGNGGIDTADTRFVRAHRAGEAEGRRNT